MVLLKEAIDTYGPPWIFNAGQGGRFTSGVIKVLADADVACNGLFLTDL